MLGMKNHFGISDSIEIREVDIAGVACTLMIPSFWADRSVQTVQTQVSSMTIQGLHCLPFCLHYLDIFYGKSTLLDF